mgnify:CR=1 FL=1
MKAKKVLDFTIGVIKRFTNQAQYVKYFDGVLNVGDVLNIDLVRYYCNKEAINSSGLHHFKHYLIVGSVVHTMNKNSYILGSGLIHPAKLNDVKELGTIMALRGENTKLYLEKKYNKIFNVPLGDPALLFPRIYKPEIEKDYFFGLVLHYVDEKHPLRYLVNEMGGRIISVQQSPESFVNEISSCENIISSSMHGLILADAYAIPNKRIILSDNIFGGDFKFEDYYSTTDTPDEKGAFLSLSVDDSMVFSVLEDCRVKKYKYNLDLLESLFRNL